MARRCCPRSAANAKWVPPGHIDPGNACARARDLLRELLLACWGRDAPCAAMNLASELSRSIEVVTNPAVGI
eukprot:6451526-Pyramimonas_sp.AAC.1